MQVMSEFQAFKHIEMLAPGEFTRATEPLEATLAIHPTLVLTNALPYVMDVIVWQVERPKPCYLILCTLFKSPKVIWDVACCPDLFSPLLTVRSHKEELIIYFTSPPPRAESCDHLWTGATFQEVAPGEDQGTSSQARGDAVL